MHEPCINGHVGDLTASGKCRQCRRDYQASEAQTIRRRELRQERAKLGIARRRAAIRDRICAKGHNTAVTGSYAHGECRQCRLDYAHSERAKRQRVEVAAMKASDRRMTEESRARAGQAAAMERHLNEVLAIEAWGCGMPKWMQLERRSELGMSGQGMVR